MLIRRSVKHVFTPEERNTYNGELLNALEACSNAQLEFDSIKATYKAKITEAEAKIGTLATTLRAGWEMRVKDVEVRFRPADKKKDFYLPGVEAKDGKPGLAEVFLFTEDMTSEDFAQDLIRAESIFSNRTEIPLWNAGEDNGTVIIGQLGARWYSAVRGKIGKQAIDERLDSEQRSYKKRFDAISKAADRAVEWIEETLGKETAKGFVEPIKAVLDIEKEKVE